MTEVCGVCGKPMRPGEARYTVTENHYDCEFPGGRKSLSDVIADADAKMAALVGERKPIRPKRREGTGAIAQRAIQRATALVERELGAPIRNLVFWNQQGGYRGPRWDLARWGFFFEFTPDGGSGLKGHVVCWNTMTEFARQANVTITRDGPLDFDVG